MELPVLPFKIPEVPLPFDIPVLMHPPVAHFIIALPVIVLLLEIINLFAKKRAIGVVSFFLLILTVVASAAAYLTGSVDGKEAWDLLSQAGQAEVKEHKILGTYLMLVSGVVLVFKLLSSMISRGLMKLLFLLVLIVFVAGILKQGKEGGELVYIHGANVKIVKIKDDELFDCKDDLSDYVAEEKEAEEEAAAAEAEKTAGEKVEAEKPVVETPAVEKVEAATEETASEKATPVETTPEVKVETPTETVKENVEAVTEAVTETVEAVTTPATESIPEVEVVPTPADAQPEIATH